MNIGRNIYNNIENVTESPSNARRILGGASAFFMIDLGILVANLDMSNTDPKKIAYSVGAALCFGGSIAAFDGYHYGRSINHASPDDSSEIIALELAAEAAPTVDALDV